MDEGVAPLNAKDIRDRVFSVLRYNPITGLFLWIDPPANHPRLRGTVAGGNSTGYTVIKIDGQKYKAHRLAWLVMTGAWPDHRIDHCDGDAFNNSWSNLRPCNQSQNNANKVRNRGKTLPKGVRSVGRSFQARIKCSGVALTLGTYPTIAEAEQAYAFAAANAFGEFARAS